MSLSNDTTMLVQPAYGNNGGGGFGNGNNDWWILILFLLFGWGRGGWGGDQGGGQRGGGVVYGGCGCGCATTQDVSNGFALNNITGGIQAIQQGICDSTYALNNSIMTGFHGVDNALCNLGYQTQQGFNTIGYALKDCCCQTQRAIDGLGFGIQKSFCDLGSTLNMHTRDIIDNQNANYRGLMDFLVQEKISEKDAKIAELQSRVAISDQNAVLGARIDASVAEILRRTGNDCPVSAYLVNAPTPVNFPTNCCGQVQFGGNGCGCGNGYAA